MSEQITAVEIDGRINELQRQRDEALTRCAILSGQVEVLKSEFITYKTKIEELQKSLENLVKKEGEDSTMYGKSES